MSTFLTNAHNFYLLKICLNLFEISNRVLKFENLIEIIIPSDFFFKYGRHRVVPCACVQPYHVINLYTSTPWVYVCNKF